MTEEEEQAWFDAEYSECKFCGCSNGHSLSCVKIQRDFIDGESTPSPKLLEEKGNTN